jgi:Domain of unknown function (DUF4349)
MKWITVLCLLVLMACKKNQRQELANSVDQKMPAAVENAIAKEAATPIGLTDSVGGGGGMSSMVMQNGGGAPLLDYDKKIIKTGHMRVEVANFRQYNTNLRKTVKAFGAYVAQEDQQESSYSIHSSLSIKVPVAQFDDLMNELAGSDAKLLERKVSSEDVSMEVVDTKGRIEARKQMRAKYYELLKDAHKMDDILSIQNEINTIQENLESADGRLQYLQHSASFSTINLEVAQILQADEPQKDQDSGFVSRAGNALGAGAKVVKELVLALITIWPFLLAIAGIVWWIYRRKKPVMVPSNPHPTHSSGAAL